MNPATRILLSHRSTPAGFITGFAARASRDAQGGLRFRYELQGDIARIALPAPAAARHTDALWRHTCCEAFIASEGAPGYVECNFAPSSAWAVYRFARYRHGMVALAPTKTPQVTLHATHDRLVLEARLTLAGFAGQPLRLGLTAVIEDAAGGRSYWALRHPRATPDFHHRGGFILRLD